jgi:hypothetical protein
MILTSCNLSWCAVGQTHTSISINPTVTQVAMGQSMRLVNQFRSSLRGGNKKEGMLAEKSGTIADKVLSFAANDAHQMTWCCIQKLCINSGEEQYTWTELQLLLLSRYQIRPPRLKPTSPFCFPPS